MTSSLEIVLLSASLKSVGYQGSISIFTKGDQTRGRKSYHFSRDKANCRGAIVMRFGNGELK